MPTINVIDKNAQVVGEVELDPRVFDVEPNPAMIQETVRAQQATRRQGTASTQTRAEVSLTGAKAWRQKGTGRARHGSRRAPIFVGGGVAFGPKPRSYAFKPPKRVRREALKMVLTARARGEGTLVVMEDFTLPEIKTKVAAEILKPIFGKQSALVILPEDHRNTTLSLRNVQGVTVKSPDRLNVYDVLRHDVLVLTRASLESVTEGLSSWTRM